MRFVFDAAEKIHFTTTNGGAADGVTVARFSLCGTEPLRVAMVSAETGLLMDPIAVPAHRVCEVTAR